MTIFVVTSGAPHYNREDILFMYRSSYQSLKLFYLYYDGRKIGPTLLFKLANIGSAPCLREIHLSTENMAMASGIDVSTAKELAAFLLLELLKMIDTFSTRHTPTHNNHITSMITCYILWVIAVHFFSIFKSLVTDITL